MKKTSKILLSAAVCLILSGCGSRSVPPVSVSSDPSASFPAERSAFVTVYLPSENLTAVSPRKIRIRAGDRTVKTAADLMIRLDRQQEHPLLPAGLDAKEVYVKDGIATINFSRELKSLAGGEPAEKLFIEMTVDTLTDFPDVQKVRFEIEGMPVKKLAGQTNMTTSFSRGAPIFEKQ